MSPEQIKALKEQIQKMESEEEEDDVPDDIKDAQENTGADE